jgi:hypothetical protein
VVVTVLLFGSVVMGMTSTGDEARQIVARATAGTHA